MGENMTREAQDTTSKTIRRSNKSKNLTLQDLRDAKAEKLAQIEQLKKDSATLGRRIGAKIRVQRKEAERAEKANRRKERTHRLCVIGGIIESAGACEISNIEKFKEWAFAFGYKIRQTQGLPGIYGMPTPQEREEFEAKQADIEKQGIEADTRR